MNVIFLDIDGPLVNLRAHVAFNGKRQIIRDFDPVGLGIVNRLCEESGAKIVISSTWRLFDGRSRREVLGKHIDNPNSLFDLREHLCYKGLTNNFHEDWKTNLVKMSSTRGMEIRDWLDDHSNISHWCAIDDCYDFADDMMPNVVLVNSDDGISYSNYIKARELLKD